MKVFLVKTSHTCWDDGIDGIFSTREKALIVIKNNNGGLFCKPDEYILEIEIDKDYTDLL
jgi:hypothetical protein